MNFYTNLLKSLLQNASENTNDINELKNINNYKTNMVTTYNNLQHILIEYEYKNYKFVYINYNIICHDASDNIAFFNGNIIVKHLSNTLIYPEFSKSCYKDEPLNNISINLQIDENKIYVNGMGLLDKKLLWKAKIEIINL